MKGNEALFRQQRQERRRSARMSYEKKIMLVDAMIREEARERVMDEGSSVRRKLGLLDGTTGNGGVAEATSGAGR